MRQTMGIVAVVLVLAFGGMARATIVNPNSIIIDEIEYYVQTDKSVYDLGENVEMLYRVTNLRNEEVTFSSPRLPEWNFWVEKNGENIWRAINTWYTMATKFTLSPGESKEFPSINPPYIWDMRDNENNLVNLGGYSVIGGLYDGSEYYNYTKIDVPIEIIPEPSTILFLAMGMVGVRARYRNKSRRYKHG